MVTAVASAMAPEFPQPGMNANEFNPHPCNSLHHRPLWVAVT